MRRALRFFAWFVALELLWAVLVGTRQSTELVAGLGASALGAGFAELLRSQGLMGYSVDWPLLAKAWKLPWLVPFDFGVATWVLVRALVHRRRIRGRWVTVPFRTAPGSAGRWERAFAVATSNGAANAIVVDLRDDEALMHALDSTIFTARTVL
ncbi:MAG: hypothetical protein ACJ76I_04665 [Gaiellaceae bacterium]